MRYGRILMMKDSEKSFYIKLYTVIGLCGAIVICMLFLTLSGGVGRISGSLTAQSTAPAVSPTVSAAATPSPVPSKTPEPTADTESDDSLLRIVNRQRPLRAEYVPQDLTEPAVATEGTEYLRREAADAIAALFAAAREAGHELVLISGYRSYEFEVRNQQYYIGLYGEEYASHVDCIPGANEHQLGLAADLGTADRTCRLDSCFAGTEAGRWLSENAWRYGWILRYPEGKEDVTGIMYSPWNYRYVGTEAAVRIFQSGLTMEEYYGE